MFMDKQPKSSMTLAFDAKRLFNNYTGLGNYSRTLVCNLQSCFPDHQYHLFTPKASKNSETEYFFDESKFTIHTPERWNPLWRTCIVSNKVNEINPDIFHGLSHEIPFGLDERIKTIVTFHDLIYEKYPEQFGIWDRNLYHFKYKNAAKRVDHIVAISKSTATDLEKEYKIAEDKISVVYQSCNELFLTSDASERNTELLKELKDYYLYVGSIIERKGLVQIILAYAKLNQVYRKPLVIIGRGDQNYTKKVKDLITYYRLEKDVFFLNNISNQDLISIYDHCFCLIYPSIYEGFGIPVIESLSRKRPVVTSNISSLPEAAGPGGILVNPFEPEEIAFALENLHQKDYYHKIATQGYEYVIQNFTKEITAQRLIEVYSKVLSRL
jgi:glycosyltransferase involved in cell wall biosynthesis